MKGSEYGVWCQGIGLRVYGAWFMIQSVGLWFSIFRMSGVGCRVSGFRFEVQGLVCRAWVFRIWGPVRAPGPQRSGAQHDRFRPEDKGPDALTPNTVELNPSIGALFYEAGPTRTRFSHNIPCGAQHGKLPESGAGAGWRAASSKVCSLVTALRLGAAV